MPIPDPEARRRYFQRYRQQRAEELKECQRRWYEENRERANERDRENYQKRRRLRRAQDVLSVMAKVGK